MMHLLGCGRAGLPNDMMPCRCEWQSPSWTRTWPPERASHCPMWLHERRARDCQLGACRQCSRHHNNIATPDGANPGRFIWCCECFHSLPGHGLALTKEIVQKGMLPVSLHSCCWPCRLMVYWSCSLQVCTCPQRIIHQDTCACMLQPCLPASDT